MHPSEGAPIVERVLCALDVEQPILSAVALAELIATRFGVALEVLHVDSVFRSGPFQSKAQRVQELMALHNVGQRLDQLVHGRGGPESTTTRLVSGQTVETRRTKRRRAHQNAIRRR